MKNSTINDTETKAIYDYMSTKSYIINEKLRTNEMLTDEDVKSFMHDYKIGNTITYAEYLSTTKGEIYNSDGQVQIFIQDSKIGKDISSINNGEKEVLYKRNSSFVVINVVDKDGTYNILAVEDHE